MSLDNVAEAGLQRRQGEDGGVDDVGRHFAAENGRGLRRSRGLEFGEGFSAVEGGVRSGYDAGVNSEWIAGRNRLSGPDVEACGRDLAGVQGFDEILLMNEASAGSIEQDYTGLHLCEGLLIKKADGLRGGGEMEGEIVALREQIIEGDEVDARIARPDAWRAFLPWGRSGNER